MAKGNASLVTLILCSYTQYDSVPQDAKPKYSATQYDQQKLQDRTARYCTKRQRGVSNKCTDCRPTRRL